MEQNKSLENTISRFMPGTPTQQPRQNPDRIAPNTPHPEQQPKPQPRSNPQAVGEFDLTSEQRANLGAGSPRKASIPDRIGAYKLSKDQLAKLTSDAGISSLIAKLHEYRLDPTKSIEQAMPYDKDGQPMINANKYLNSLSRKDQANAFIYILEANDIGPYDVRRIINEAIQRADIAEKNEYAKDTFISKYDSVEQRQKLEALKRAYEELYPNRSLPINLATLPPAIQIERIIDSLPDNAPESIAALLHKGEEIYFNPSSEKIVENTEPLDVNAMMNEAYTHEISLEQDQSRGITM